MKTLVLENPVKTYYVKASAFPSGVEQAHQALHALVPFDERRKYFGFSWPDQGAITYLAAAEELFEGELAQYGLETKTIQKGTYLYIDIFNFMDNIPAIGAAFQQLIHDERIAPDGFCIEWYLTQKDCRCMVSTQTQLS